MVGKQPLAQVILQFVKTVTSHSKTGHISAVIKMTMTKIANVRAHAVQDLMKISSIFKGVMMLYLPICFLLNRNKKFLNRTVFFS